MAYLKEQNKLVKTVPEDFTTVLNIFKELKENVDKELKYIRKIIHEQNETVNNQKLFK